MKPKHRGLGRYCLQASDLTDIQNFIYLVDNNDIASVEKILKNTRERKSRRIRATSPLATVVKHNSKLPQFIFEVQELHEKYFDITGLREALDI